MSAIGHKTPSSRARVTRAIANQRTNSNRHKLARLEISVTTTKQTPRHRSNRHIWPFSVHATTLELLPDFHFRRLKLPTPAARIVPDQEPIEKQAP
jgi:hypothetical protein